MIIKLINMKLWQQVVVGMFLGILCGYLLGTRAAVLQPLAAIYMSLLKMIIVPAIFFAILYGITSVSDIKVLGRIGLKAMLWYGFSIAVAVALGIFFANVFLPGIGTHIDFGQTAATLSTITANPAPHKVTDILLNIIPTNPIAAMAEGNILQMVFFTMFLGIAIILVGEKAGDLKDAIVVATNVVFKMVNMVIKVTPIGVFAIIASLVGEFGFALIISLGKLALVILGAFAIQYLFFAVMLLLVGLKPLQFYRKTFNVQSLAFATATGKATIPTAIMDLQEKAGVSRRTAGLILPLGAACNATGSAIYISICALFFAQIVGMHLTMNQYVILIFTSTLGSVGAAGIPGGGVLMLGMVLSALGLPLEGIPLIMGIDRVIDMFRTTVNVTGDCAVTVIVDKMEKTLDQVKYDAALSEAPKIHAPVLD